MPNRIALTRKLVDGIVPDGSPVDRERLTRLLVVLTGTAAFRTWHDHVGSSVDQAAEDVEWAVRALIAASTEDES